MFYKASFTRPVQSSVCGSAIPDEAAYRSCDVEGHDCRYSDPGLLCEYGLSLNCPKISAELRLEYRGCKYFEPGPYYGWYGCGQRSGHKAVPCSCPDPKEINAQGQCACPEDRPQCQNGYIWKDASCSCQPAQNSPVLVDISGNGFNLTNVSGGVNFDLDRDGATERLSWTTANSDDAWLALDRNRNGLIDDGQELFGNFTLIFMPSQEMKDSIKSVSTVHHLR